MIDFSNAQYRSILAYMLSQIPDDYDKRDVSPIPTAISPAAYVFEGFFISLNMVQRQAFFQTATGESLDLLAPLASVSRKQATAAIRKGEFDTAIPIGTRFSTINGSDSINFVVISALGAGHAYRLQAETPGSIGNVYSGPILPIDTIQGLSSARLSNILTPGDDTETDEELRARILAALNSRAFGGNVAQYVEEIEKLDGVGAVQVYPTWKGGGTVLCSVLGADWLPASADLVRTIDTVENDGKPARRVSIQITAGQTAYICHQVGVYGKLDTGPDETLLMVVQDDRGVEIPAASTSSDFKIELAVLLAVSNNANISVTVSPQVQAIMQLVEKELEQHDSDPNAHASVIEAAASAAVKRVEESGQIMTEAQVKKLIQTHSGSGYFGEYILVLRADGWTPLPDTGPYQYIYDAALADSDSTLIPSGSTDVNDFAVTARAGVLNACETRDGSVRFFSQRVPDADIHVMLTLNGSGKGGGTNASGNVTIGQGLKRDESGAIAVSIGDGLAFDATDALTVRKDTVVTSDDLVNDEKLSQEIAEILK